jgi:hypothetical protein
MASLQSLGRRSIVLASLELERTMLINLQATMTEADFKRPLLDAAEDRLVREAHGEVDLAVEGLRDTLLSRLVRLVSGGGGRS